MQEHECYMQRCLQLAVEGLGNVAPNPLVGAVIVHEGEIIGEGYHRQFGGPHAEVEAIQNVPSERKHLLAHATLYVSLEPCAHYGKTPPCTQLILMHKIPRVVIGCIDPFNEVNGAGVKQLQNAGVEVTIPVLEKECKFLNRRFFFFHQHKRPFIILKWAESADGFLSAKGEQTKISGFISDQQVHRWRSEEQAILVGANTVRVDDPELTVRYWTGKNPVRIFIDRKLAIPRTAKIYNQSAPTIIINHILDKEEGNLLFLKMPEEENLLPYLCGLLYQRNLQSLLVEGGANIINQFISLGCFDEIRQIVSQEKYLHKGVPAPVPGLDPFTMKEWGRDRIYVYQNLRK